jgi:hypothetical protein
LLRLNGHDIEDIEHTERKRRIARHRQGHRDINDTAFATEEKPPNEWLIAPRLCHTRGLCSRAGRRCVERRPREDALPTQSDLKRPERPANNLRAVCRLAT